MNVWIQAARPKTLIAVISPVILGTLLASKVQFDMLIFLLTLLAGLSIQIATNYANDYYDFKKGVDLPSQTKKAIAANLVREKSMLVAMVISITIALACSLYLSLTIHWSILLLGIICACLAIFYSASKLALSYTGFAEPFAIVFFGPVATLYTYYFQTKMLSSEALYLGLACGFLANATMCANNLRDYVQDKNANKRTLVVRFGKAFGNSEYCLSIILASIATLLCLRSGYFYLLPALWLIKGLFLFYKIQKNHELPSLLPKTAKLYSEYFSLCFLVLVFA